MVSLGLVPTFLRNFILISALEPANSGFKGFWVNMALGLGAISVSHPFEVARIHMQYNNNNSLGSVLKNTYAKEGFYALYRGLIPRVMHIMPAYAAWFSFKSLP